MTLWWFLPPLVLLVGVAVALLQGRALRRHHGELHAQVRDLTQLQPAVARVRDDVNELRANLAERPHR